MTKKNRDAVANLIEAIVLNTFIMEEHVGTEKAAKARIRFDLCVAMLSDEYGIDCFERRKTDAA